MEGEKKPQRTMLKCSFQGGVPQIHERLWVGRDLKVPTLKIYV